MARRTGGLSTLVMALARLTGRAAYQEQAERVLAAWGETLRSQLADIAAGSERVETLDAELRRARGEYSELAAKLGEQRRSAATRSSKNINPNWLTTASNARSANGRLTASPRHQRIAGR